MLDRKNSRDIYPATGTEITAKSWQTEAAMRMLMNNLHPDVAENPHELVVYGGIGRAARSWGDFDRIVATLKDLNDDETLLVQSGRPVAVVRTHKDAPRVLIANSNLVPHWATWETSSSNAPAATATFCACSDMCPRWIPSVASAFMAPKFCARPTAAMVRAS